MKKTLFFILLLISVFSCGKKQEEKKTYILNKEQYKSIMKDLILAQKLQEVIVKEDSLGLDPVALVYKQYHTDSLQLKKATDYYTKDPQIFVDIYTSIKKELKTKLDSLEKNIDSAGRQKIKTDSIKIKKGVIDKIFNKKRKDKK